MATHLIENAAESVGMLGMELFGYNRQNFKYDRKQRLKMEYELAEMRVKQAELWRDDVRQTADLTPKKMEMYLIVIALELGFCVMALCKARVPAGAPPWLVACHTLSVCGSLMYLFPTLVWYACLRVCTGIQGQNPDSNGEASYPVLVRIGGLPHVHVCIREAQQIADASCSLPGGRT